MTGEWKVGRPPLNVKPILVRLPNDVPERIDAIAGKNRRGEFIREAVQKELERREAKSTE
jgi:metal-responsive CopG/Arc/MetJ family transcriptional regulator